MTYEQAKKLRVGDRIRLKTNPAHPDGLVITITDRQTASLPYGLRMKTAHGTGTSGIRLRKDKHGSYF